MRLLDELRAEHLVIDRTLGSFRAFVDALLAGSADRVDGLEFIRFFERYAGAFHHEREEHVLIPALEREAGISTARGPLAVILDDHRRMAALLASLRTHLERLPGTPEELARLRETAVRYSRELWHHIDAENSVLFPECETRLGRQGIRELPSREATVEETALAARAATLALRYPPLDDPGIVRGEGCALCPAYGERCDGIEQEWWNEYEWEELDGRISAT